MHLLTYIPNYLVQLPLCMEHSILGSSTSRSYQKDKNKYTGARHVTFSCRTSVTVPVTASWSIWTGEVALFDMQEYDSIAPPPLRTGHLDAPWSSKIRPYRYFKPCTVCFLFASGRPRKCWHSLIAAEVSNETKACVGWSSYFIV